VALGDVNSADGDRADRVRGQARLRRAHATGRRPRPSRFLGTTRGGAVTAGGKRGRGAPLSAMTESGMKRRSFLSLAASGSVAVGLAGREASSQSVASPVTRPSPAVAIELDAYEADPPTATPAETIERVGSDFMVDVVKSLKIDYVAATPGSSFRSLQESFTVYGNNVTPEFLTCLHEEASVAMAHGYSKITGKPMAVLLHNTVGLQHASMAIYNAYCDRVPVLLLIGNTADALSRRGGAEWYHSDTDPAAMVRNFTKWDDQPASLGHFAESTVRAYKVAMTPPMGPAIVTADKGLQESASSKAGEPRIPGLPRIAFPAADAGAVEDVARALAGASAPVLIADRLVRSPEGLRDFVALAELLQAPVLAPEGARMSFPQLHPLFQNYGGRDLVGAADVIVGFEMSDFWSSVNALRDKPVSRERRIARPDARLISIGTSDLFLKAGPQTVQRFLDVDLSIGADGEATLPALVEAVRRLLDKAGQGARDARRRALEVRKARLAQQFWRDAGYAWNASPVSTARLSFELWQAIKTRDWSLVHTPRGFTSFWDKSRPYHDIGRSGGSGVGYAAPASVGAALANRERGRLSVAIQPDGDLMFSPGVLWTAAHHRIPILSVMHNNRAYHQEVMHLQRMACEHNRGIDRCTIGTTIDNPNIDYAMLARSMGVYAEGPISDPAKLAPALRRAIAVVDAGEPALLDVVCQPR